MPITEAELQRRKKELEYQIANAETPNECDRLIGKKIECQYWINKLQEEALEKVDKCSFFSSCCPPSPRSKYG